MSKGAVTKYLQARPEAGLGWPLPAETDDAALEALLFPHAAPPPGLRRAAPVSPISTRSSSARA